MAEQKKTDPAAALNDISEFMQKMWNPFGVPIPGFGLPGTAPGAAGAPPVACPPVAVPVLPACGITPTPPAFASPGTSDEHPKFKPSEQIPTAAVDSFMASPCIARAEAVEK